MLDVLLDTVMDGLKLLPFLFLAFLIMELIEHKMSNKNRKIIENSGKYGPIVGGLLGMFPQCGFSAFATNLYVGRIITLGTLISVYLSTSDEMLPLLIAEEAPFNLILSTLLIKLFIGMLCGVLIDLFLNKQAKIKKEEIHSICEHDHCSCEDGIFKSTIIHTLKIFIFIFIASFILNTLIFYIGEDNIGKIFLKNSIFSPFISSLIGLIPNCAASVIITELYLKSAISFGSMIAGLLTGAGIGILILFKENKDIKENIKILGLIYGIGIIFGIIIDIIGSII